MVVTNYFGVFTLLLISHLIVAIVGYTQGREKNK